MAATAAPPTRPDERAFTEALAKAEEDHKVSMDRLVCLETCFYLFHIQSRGDMSGNVGTGLPIATDHGHCPYGMDIESHSRGKENKGDTRVAKRNGKASHEFIEH